MRLLILLGVIYFGYRILKSLLTSSGIFYSTRSRETDYNGNGQIDDVMVKDPYCEVYFPKRNGLHAKVDGQDLYFCSKECREKYLTLHSKG